MREFDGIQHKTILHALEINTHLQLHFSYQEGGRNFRSPYLFFWLPYSDINVVTHNIAVYTHQFSHGNSANCTKVNYISHNAFQRNSEVDWSSMQHAFQTCMDLTASNSKIMSKKAI